MHCMEIDMIKYISLSSVIAKELNFQNLLLKNNAFWVVSFLYQTSEMVSKGVGYIDLHV